MSSRWYLESTFKTFIGAILFILSDDKSLFHAEARAYKK